MVAWRGGWTPALFNETVTLHFKHQLLLDQESPALHLRKSAQVSLVVPSAHDGLRGPSGGGSFRHHGKKAEVVRM